MRAALALGLLLAAPPAPLWLTLDVLNPETVGGHRLLHLEDVVGPDQRGDIPGLPQARAVLAFTVRPEGCVSRTAGVCAEVAARTADLRARGALVVAVLVGARQGVSLGDIPRARHPFPVARDAHGVARRALGIDGPGGFVVINSEGQNIRAAAASKTGDARLSGGDLVKARQVLSQALGRDEEDEG